MGILNVTPDSFSDGGAHNGFEAAVAHAQRLVEEGADIIDVGGESTRPGSDEVSLDEELARVLPVVERLAKEGMVVSIDTRHAQVAAACVEAGAAIINDVSGFRDPAMVEVAAAPGCTAGLVIMHMLGEPKTMQASEPQYDNVVLEVSAYLLNRARELEAAGIARSRICIDPGPGFGKTVEHNLELLSATHEMSVLGYPLMAAYSRKTFLGKLTGIAEPGKRIASSVTVAAYAASQGAHVLRVHDVAPTVESLTVLRNLHV
jgi:dihydropteroate synthase